MKLFTCLFFVCSSLHLGLRAQEIIFSYDESGNRTERNIIILDGQTSSGTESYRSVNSIMPIKDTQLKAPSYPDELGGTSIRIYPNPTLGELHVAFAESIPATTVHYRLYSLTGNQLQEGLLQEKENTIDLINYQPGIYLLDMILAEERIRWKVIKQ
jgi:hypothetical protein